MEMFWHRRDLRLADNVGLAAAVDRTEDGVAPLFVFDDDVESALLDVTAGRKLVCLGLSDRSDVKAGPTRSIAARIRERSESDVAIARGSLNQSDAAYTVD